MHYRLSARPGIQKTGITIVIPRPVKFAITNRPALVQGKIATQKPPAPKPAPKPSTPTLDRPRLVPQMMRPPNVGKVTIITQNARRQARNHVRPSPLVHIAKERERQLSASRGAIQSLKRVGHGRILVIIGNGPSVSEAPLEKLKGHPKIDAMSINKPDRRLWPTRFWCFTDQNQYGRNKEFWDNYSGMVVNSGSVRERRQNQVLVRNLSGIGFSRDLANGFYIGRSSVFAAMQVAYWMDYMKVYIFGVDMTAVNGKLHFYGQNPDVNNKIRVTRFKGEAESFMYAAKTLSDGEREKFIFCSSYNPWPFVSRFSRLDQKLAIDEILKTAGKSN
jgi:hypothetical protein